jgi:hypothetical protein
MKALFTSVKAYAVFAAKPHLFRTSEPFQLGANSENGGVFVSLVSGSSKQFAARVEQFGGCIVSE